MTSPARRLFFWISLLLYLAGSAWWLVVAPHHPEHLLRAIPGQATLVTYHEGLDARWDSLGEHPLVLIAAGASGLDAEAWRVLRDDPGLRNLIAMLGQRELAIAYVPFLNYHQEGAWVIASWIGGRSQRLRWSQPFLNVPGLQSAGVIGGWPVWQWSWESDLGRQHLTLALVEGMLVATTARDPLAMQMILDAYNGGFPSVASRLDLDEANRHLLTSPLPDRGWFRPPFGRDPLVWRAELDLSDTNRAAGVLQLEGAAPPGVLPDALELDDMARLWRDAPIGIAAVGLDALLPLLGRHAQWLPVALMRDAVVASGAKSAVLALFGGEHSGRFRGIKVPALMAALRMPEAEDPASLIANLVDRWNATRRLGLLPVMQPINGVPVWRLEGISGGVYGGLAPTEQVAVAAVGSWLVVASNYRTLELLVREPHSPDAAAPWTSALNEVAGVGLGHLAFDLVRSTEAFRLAITAYALKLLFEDAGGTRDQRQKLNEAKAWLEVFARLDRLGITLSAAGSDLKIDFRAGP